MESNGRKLLALSLVSAYAQKQTSGNELLYYAIGVMINHRLIGLLHISFCKRRAGFVSFAEFSCCVCKDSGTEDKYRRKVRKLGHRPVAKDTGYLCI